jgi:hypothetical protein
MWCHDAMHPDAVVSLFVRGLSEPYKSACSQDPVTLKPYPNLALVYEKAKGMEKSRKQQHKQTPPVSSAVQTAKRTGNTHTNTSPQASKKPKLTTTQGAGNGGRDRQWCWYCEDAGFPRVRFDQANHGKYTCKNSPHYGKKPGDAGPSGSGGGAGGSGGGAGPSRKLGANSIGGKGGK